MPPPPPPSAPPPPALPHFFSDVHRWILFYYVAFVLIISGFAFFWSIQGTAQWQCKCKHTQDGSLEEMTKISSCWVSVFFLFHLLLLHVVCADSPSTPPRPPTAPIFLVVRGFFLFYYSMYSIVLILSIFAFFWIIWGTALWQCQQKKTWLIFLEETMKISSI